MCDRYIDFVNVSVNGFSAIYDVREQRGFLVLLEVL